MSPTLSFCIAVSIFLLLVAPITVFSFRKGKVLALCGRVVRIKRLSPWTHEVDIEQLAEIGPRYSIKGHEGVDLTGAIATITSRVIFPSFRNEIPKPASLVEVWVGRHKFWFGKEFHYRAKAWRYADSIRVIGQITNVS